LDLLDYEYDSEAEWEEDEPGEELKSDDDLDDEEEIMDCEDDDNDVFDSFLNNRDGWFLTGICRMMKALMGIILISLLNVV
jgi:hypothetical protein